MSSPTASIGGCRDIGNGGSKPFYPRVTEANTLAENGYSKHCTNVNRNEVYFIAVASSCVNSLAISSKAAFMLQLRMYGCIYLQSARGRDVS